MSESSVKLNLDLTLNRAVYSRISESEYRIPYFTWGDVVAFVLDILRFEGIPNQFAKPIVTGLGIEMTFCKSLTEDPDGTSPMVTQYSWTPDTVAGTFAANVSFNTPALDTWLGSESSKTGVLRVFLIEGLVRRKIYQAEVAVHNGSASVGEVTPGSTPLSYERAVSEFVPKVQAAGDSEIKTSPSGLKFQFRIDDDGQPHWDPIT